MAAERLRSALGGWRLPALAAVWVNTVWDMDFTETEPLEPCIAEELTADGLDTFTRLYSALAPFAAGHQESRENVWTLFAESSVSHQALVAVLHHFVHVGQHKRANAQQRVFALHSAGLYLLLLEMPGSIANRMFHQVMFDKCLHTLTKCWPQEIKKRKKGQSQSSQPNARRNRKKGKPSRNNSASMEEMLEEEKEEDDENVYLSTEDLLQVRNAVFLLLKNFLRLLPKFSLKEKPQCIENCVQVLVEMTSFEPVLHEFQFSAAMDVNKAKYIPELACYGLHLLCSPLHSTEHKEEFVKWKDCLFFRFVSVLVDPNPDIARFAEFCLVHLLLKRNPVMFSQHFIECIFHFNSYEKHQKYNRFPQSQRAKQLFSLKGKENKEKRMRIYTFLLDHFTDEQRFSITTKISHSILGSIQSWLKESQCPLEVISPAVETLQKLCQASAAAPEEAQELLNQVCGDLVSTCESYISNIVLKEDGAGQLQEDLLVRHLFLLGEAAQLCPAKVDKHIFLLVQSILASSGSKDQLSACTDSEEMPSSQPLSQFRGSAMPPVVRAHALITLGKLCLQHEELAKKCIAALARELEVSPDVAVRSNAALVLCDLCVRYTSLGDRYIPNISLCLRDPHPFVRKQTLILLTNLLQEEFVKWKDCLFFRFVSVLVDPNPDIARFAEFCLVHLLLKRNPVMFSQHFIECIFHFNSYEKHQKYNRFPQSQRAKQLFSLKGKENKEKRMRIYTFLLDHFTDEQRFSITTKISHSILACFVDEILPLDLEGSELLSDTFAVLSCKEIKLSSMRSKPDEDIQADEDEMAMANAVMQVAQKKLISQVQKKNFIENIIPIITSLKSLMEQKRIPALKDLMNCLREMMQDYRNEIKDFFAVDKQLAAELEYDMKKYEEQLAREKESEQEQLPAAHREQTPSLERAAAPGGQNDCSAQPSGGGRPSTPGSIPPPGPSEFATPRAEALKQPLVGRRAASLSTLAILTSARKALQERCQQRSRSVGRSLSASSEAAGTAGSHQVSFQSLNQQSSGGTMAGVGRAISTPEETMNELTFGAGVSYISLMHTPHSAPVKKEAEDGPRDIICLTSPEKPPCRPREWKVESPAQRSGQAGSLRRSQRRNPRRADT
nr:condensin-2 complex subunit D3 [Zonotrichia albicollis]